MHRYLIHMIPSAKKGWDCFNSIPKFSVSREFFCLHILQLSGTSNRLPRHFLSNTCFEKSWSVSMFIWTPLTIAGLKICNLTVIPLIINTFFRKTAVLTFDEIFAVFCKYKVSIYLIWFPSGKIGCNKLQIVSGRKT